MDLIKALVSGGLWPLVLFFGTVSVATVIALIRADRKDIPLVFSSFAEAFGIHSRPSVGIIATTPDVNAMDDEQQGQPSNDDAEPVDVKTGESVDDSTELPEIHSSTSENDDNGA